jgi:predicted transcriptional regulator
VYRKKTQVLGEAAMIPAKEEVRRLLELLPDDASLEDIQYHIYVRQKILRGLEDIEAGHTLPEEEFEARMSQWLAP